MPIHIHSLLFLFISSVLIPLFAIVLNFSFPFILISTHPILSLLLCYSISILQSIFLSFIPYSPLHPPSLLYSLLIHPLIPILSTFSSLLHHLPITLPIHSFPHHPLSPILFSFHPSSYSISTPLSFPLLPLSSTSHYRIRFSPSILLFVPILLSILILLLLLLLLTPLSTIILFHTHSHTLHSVHSLLSYLSFFLLEPSSLPFLFIPLLSISFNHFFHHIINHFLLLFPSHFDHSFFNKYNNQIST